jgi:amino acid transporter
MSIAWTFLYNETSVSHYTLAVTLASMLVYLGTMLAAIVFPYRAREIYKASPAAAYKIFGLPMITVLGSIAFIFNAVMAVYYLTNSKLFVNDPGSEALIGGILVGCVLYYYGRRLWLKHAGYEPDMAFTTIPPE